MSKRMIFEKTVIAQVKQRVETIENRLNELLCKRPINRPKLLKFRRELKKIYCQACRSKLSAKASQIKELLLELESLSDAQIDRIDEILELDTKKKNLINQQTKQTKGGKHVRKEKVTQLEFGAT
jgi:hypothetical protein